MDRYEAIETIKLLVIENDLPKTEMGVLGIQCPYCGKSDRIRKLESPEELKGCLSPADAGKYVDVLERLNPTRVFPLGVCRFCHNPVELRVQEGYARPLDETD